jgi:drug/metabolite transporter (DMT)-like permease
VGPVRASIYSTVEPAFTLVLAAVLLGERVTALRVAGGALIVGAVVLLARADLARGGTGPSARRVAAPLGEGPPAAPPA